MILDELERKTEEEGLTVEEVMEYRKLIKPVQHIYGKWGTLAKKYLEDTGIDWTIANLPEYLHGVDKAADELYDIMHEKLSKDERYIRTGNYLEDVRRIGEIQRLIEEEILNEIVYVD